MTRFIGIEKFREVADILNAYSIYTTETIKLWDKDIDGAGNELDNLLIGNRGNNTLKGHAGNDTLSGGEGEDDLYGGAGDDIYMFNLGDGKDSIIEGHNNGVDILKLGGRDEVSIQGDLESIVFANGVVWDTLELEDQLQTDYAIQFSHFIFG